MKFTPHSQKQSDALFSDKAVTCVTTGIQWGKTKVGSVWLKRRQHMFTGKYDNFLVTAPTYKILGQSTLPQFMSINEQAGTYNKATAEFQIHGGGKVYFRTGTDADSVVGITNVRGIWCDEAGKYSLYFWDNIEARAAFCNCPIMLTTSPYSLNWIFTKIIQPYRKGERPDCMWITARSDENPYFPKDVFEERKKHMDPRRFKAIYGGEFEQMQGLVYDCFSFEENIIDTADLSEARFFGGIDWGWNDPFVFKIRAITPNGNHYAVSEFYKQHMTLSEIGQTIKAKMQQYKINAIYCDPSRPEHIEELRRPPYSCPCLPANNAILTGIDLHYELMKSRRFKLIRGANPYTEDELTTYHWPEPEDLKPDQDTKEEKPVDQNNHCFAGGTLITTINGEKPISKISEGDLVLTRSGFREVVRAWSEGKRRVIDINGVWSTPEHKFYTKNLGWVSAESLTVGDRLFTVSECINTLTGRNTTYTRTKNIIAGVVRDYTLLCGSITTDLFLKAFTSTIRILILVTTTLRILSLLKRLSIFRYMLREVLRMLRGYRRREKTLRRLENLRKSGTVPRQELSGIRHMERMYSAKRTEGRLRRTVLGVARSLKLTTLCREGQNIVLAGVRQRIEEVYNLEIRGAFEFFAGGYLVLNCMDCDRYITIMTYRVGAKKQPKPHESPIKIQRQPERPIDIITRIRKNKFSSNTENWS